MSNYSTTLKTCTILMVLDAVYKSANELPIDHGMLRFAERFPDSMPQENLTGRSSPYGNENNHGKAQGTTHLIGNLPESVFRGTMSRKISDGTGVTNSAGIFYNRSRA